MHALRLSAAGLALYGIASGYAAVAAPPAVNPALIQKRFDEPKAMPANDGAAPPVISRQRATQKIQEQFASQRFVLKNVVIKGATVFSESELQAAYQEQLGQEISLLDVQGIVKRINSLYRKNDYVLSQAVVPAQDVQSGTLTIQVLEGYIHNIVIQGDTLSPREGEIIAAYAQEIKNKHPIKTGDLERYLLLMDDLPGSGARGLVRPSQTQPGAADLVVTLDRQTYEGSYSLDNRGSKYVGPWQHTATLGLNSILGWYDRTIVRAITTSSTQELRFVDIQHEEQLGHEGTRIAATVASSRTEPNDSLKGLNLRGSSQFYQLKLLHPFVRARTENLVGRITAEVRNSLSEINYTTKLSDDRLRILRAGGSYDFADSLRGVNLIDAEISHGFDAFNASDRGAIRSRTDGAADFTKITLDLARTQSLWDDFSLLAGMSSQYALDKLLVGEQFSLGGANFGRAFDPAGLTGDHGIAGKLELRYGQYLGDPFLQSYQIYGFYDIGRVWLRGALANENDKKSLASLGFGIRTNFSENLSCDLQFSFPKIKEASNQGNHGDGGRVFLSAVARF
jgi:hemolysin activation/secretion protein